MAIYHCSAKVIGRSSGRSATGAAAYRAGEKIVDHRTGLIHDYTRKGGVDHAQIIAPANAPEWATDRSALWNEVEAVEKRKDAQLCREVEVAIPRELTVEQQRQLVLDFAREQFVARGMVADVAFHHQDGENPHAHILLTTRTIGPDGFGQKAREWNDKQLLEQWRSQWAEHANRALERAGHAERIDHRSLADQGIDRQPTQHLGPTATAIERRTGEPSRRRLDQQAALERLQAAAAAGVAERQGAVSVVDLQTQLGAAIAERDALIQRASQGRDALFERYKAGPQAEANIELAQAYGLHIAPATAAQAEQLQRQVDSRMRLLDEAEAQRAAEAAAKPSLAELIQQPQRAPEPVPKVDTPAPAKPSLDQLLQAGTGGVIEQRRPLQPTPPLPLGVDIPSRSALLDAQGERRPRLPDSLDAYVAAVRAEREARLSDRDRDLDAAVEQRWAQHYVTATQRARADVAAEQEGIERVRRECAERERQAGEARTQAQRHRDHAGQTERQAADWLSEHWMQAKLGRTAPADELREKSRHHAGQADGWERREALLRAQSQVARRDAEQALQAAQERLQAAEREAATSFDPAAVRRDERERWDAQNPERAAQIDAQEAASAEREVQERQAAQERYAQQEAEREAERQAQCDQSDRGMSR